VTGVQTCALPICTAAELLAHYEAHPAKGEIVLVVSGAQSF